MLTTLRRLLLVLAQASLAWTLILLRSGGVRLLIGTIRISSRQPGKPAVIAAALLAIALLLAPRGRRLRTVMEDERWLFRPPVLASLLSLAMLVIFALRGVFVAGGADAYGYVSESRLFATGLLHLQLPWIHRFPHIAPETFTPLGYLFDQPHGVFTPVYSPGVPLVMSLFERAAGPDAVYLVMPLLAALTVACTYRIGRLVSGPAAGVGAALLVATSPAIVFQLVFPPMSDIAAMGWWSLALLLALSDGDEPLTRSRWRATAAGLATALAILTRPNLVLLGGVIGGYMLWQVWRDDDAGRRRALERLALFCGAAAPGCLAVAWFYDVWYGSPLRSGYGGNIWALSFWWPNIVNYLTWLTTSQTPLLLAGYAAPLLARRSPGTRTQSQVLVLAIFAATVFLSYLFYQPFDAWWYLRFLLPAYPPLAVLTCTVFALLAQRVGAPARAIGTVVVLAVAAFCVYGLREASGAGDYRYRLVAEYVRDRLPAPAMVLTFQHSGSMLFYSGQPVLRYDMVDDLDAALDDVRAAGYHPYLVVDEWEIERFKARFANRSRRGALDWPPLATLELANVHVWDFNDMSEPGRETPAVIPVPDYVRRRLP